MSLRWLPNAISLLRIALVAPIVLLIIDGRYGLALGLSLVAGFSDGVDGYLAKRFDWHTRIGALLDPIADKLLLVSCFILLSRNAVELSVRIPLWLTITVIGRDVLLVVSVAIINLTMGRHLFSPSIYGKATTFLQLLTVFMVLVVNALNIAMPLWGSVFYVTATLTVISGLHYLGRGMKLFEYNQEEV